MRYQPQYLIIEIRAYPQFAANFHPYKFILILLLENKKVQKKYSIVANRNRTHYSYLRDKLVSKKKLLRDKPAKQKKTRAKDSPRRNERN